MLARMRLDQEGFKAFTLQVPCDPNTRSINMAKKGAKKAAAEAPAPKKATTISANVDMQFSDLVGMLLQILHLFITTLFLTPHFECSPLD